MQTTGPRSQVLAPNAKLRAMVVPQGPDERAEASQPAACEPDCAHHSPVRLSWARLLKRVFALDLEHCPNCGGELKIIAASGLIETQSIAFERPGAPGRGAGLRPGVPETAQRSLIVRVDP